MPKPSKKPIIKPQRKLKIHQEQKAMYPCIPKRDPRYPGKWVYELQPVDGE